MNAEPGTVPFAISFDPSGHLVIAEAGTNALATFALAADGTVTPIDSVGTGQAATCWVAWPGGLSSPRTPGAPTSAGTPPAPAAS